MTLAARASPQAETVMTGTCARWKDRRKDGCHRKDLTRYLKEGSASLARIQQQLLTESFKCLLLRTTDVLF